MRRYQRTVAVGGTIRGRQVSVVDMGRWQLSRNQHARTASSRTLIAMAVLRPTAAQARWREEWLGELHALPARRSRAGFATHPLLGVPRLAVTPRRPASSDRQERP